MAPAGGEIDYTATLRLVSGANLAGRVIDFDYARGTERAPGDGTADAGIVDGNRIVLSKSVTTDGAGNATITVRDAAVTGTQQQGSETGGVLTAATGDNFAGDGSTLDGNADESASATTSFRAARSVGEVALNDPADGNAAGQIVTYTATVTNTDGSPLSGAVVQFSTESGFFTADERPDGREGVYTSLGRTTTATTGDDGRATVLLVIGRDEGFDDDGRVDTTVTAAADAGSDTDQYRFNSADPLNGGSVDLVRSPDAFQETNNANGAQAGDDEVLYDVFTYDQFGNEVAAPLVDLAASPSRVTLDQDEVASDFEREGDVSVGVSGDSSVDARVTATWEAGDATTADVNDTREFTDSETVAFYGIDYASLRLRPGVHRRRQPARRQHRHLHLHRAGPVRRADRGPLRRLLPQRSLRPAGRRQRRRVHRRGRCDQLHLPGLGRRRGHDHGHRHPQPQRRQHRGRGARVAGERDDQLR